MGDNMIGELNMYRESGIKPNFSDIARRYHRDRHTVAAYWKADGCEPPDGRRDKPGSFDGHMAEIEAKAALPGVTKKGIHEWLLHRYPDEGLAGYNAFTQFMRKKGIVIGPQGGAEPHPRFETPPGLQLQFDWKESIRMANRDGELFEFNVFAATLGHSRRHVYIRSNTRTTDDLVRCMYLTIMRLGGVPREWVTDNMSALVTLKGGRRSRIGRVWTFAKDAGFELKLCRPRSPQTKGKVESSNRFLSRLMAYQGDFGGWDDIDAIIARIEERSNSEVNETTGMPPCVLFMDEKDALLPIGNARALEEAMGDVVRVGKVPSTMLVSARGEKMSVPRRCIGRPARVVVMPGGAMDCYAGGGWWPPTRPAGRPTTRRTTPRPWPASAGSATPPETSRRPPRPTSGCSTRSGARCERGGAGQPPEQARGKPRGAGARRDGLVGARIRQAGGRWEEGPGHDHARAHGRAARGEAARR